MIAISPTGKVLYRRKQCGEAFCQERNLKTQETVHTGRKLFKCMECGKVFGSVRGSNIHERIKTGEKPVKCKQCNNALIQAGNLKVH